MNKVKLIFYPGLQACYGYGYKYILQAGINSRFRVLHLIALPPYYATCQFY